MSKQKNSFLAFLNNNKKTIIGMLAVVALWTVFILTVLRPVKYAAEVYRDNAELQYYAAKEELVVEVDRYMRTIAPRTSLNAIALVNECEEHDIDLIFVLAQAQIESHFGTAGLGRKTNSVFNVGAYDGSGTMFMSHYDHPDKSIKPFIQLLKKRYLTGHKTERDLMIKYTDRSGNRYASNPNYEHELVTTYKRITDESQIQDLYDKFKEFKIISGK